MRGVRDFGFIGGIRGLDFGDFFWWVIGGGGGDLQLKRVWAVVLYLYGLLSSRFFISLIVLPSVFCKILFVAEVL